MPDIYDDYEPEPITADKRRIWDKLVREAIALANKGRAK